jgi:hypothetical protein
VFACPARASESGRGVRGTGPPNHSGQPIPPVATVTDAYNTIAAVCRVAAESSATLVAPPVISMRPRRRDLAVQVDRGTTARRSDVPACPDRATVSVLWAAAVPQHGAQHRSCRVGTQQPCREQVSAFAGCSGEVGRDDAGGVAVHCAACRSISAGCRPCEPVTAPPCGRQPPHRSHEVRGASGIRAGCLPFPAIGTTSRTFANARAQRSAPQASDTRRASSASRQARASSLPPDRQAWTSNAPSSDRARPSRVDSWETFGRRTWTAGECSRSNSSTQ